MVAFASELAIFKKRVTELSKEWGLFLDGRNAIIAKGHLWGEGN